MDFTEQGLPVNHPGFGGRNMTKIICSSIAAMAENRVIGKDNALIWHIPEDLKHFKRTTMGKPIIMGRKSFEALGKPLPGRDNIVISRSGEVLPHNAPTPTYKEMESVGVGEASSSSNAAPSNLHYVTSIEAGVEKGREIAAAKGLDEIFITGGGEIYKQTLPLTDRLYLTVLHRTYEGDTYFPEFDREEWTVTAEEKHPADPETNRPAFTFFTLERKNSS